MIAAAPRSAAGEGLNGQLGTGSWDSSFIRDTSNYAVPVPVARPDNVSGWTAVSAGGEHTCAVAAGGGAYCWGELRATAAAGPATQMWTQGAAVALEACDCCRAALCRAGQGASGQLGAGSKISSNVPVAVVLPDGGSGWTVVSAGQSHTCALTIGGGAYCWGELLAAAGPATQVRTPESAVL